MRPRLGSIADFNRDRNKRRDIQESWYDFNARLPLGNTGHWRLSPLSTIFMRAASSFHPRLADAPGVQIANVSNSREPEQMAMHAALGHFQNAEQIAFWNGPAGQRWVERQTAQDALLAPMSDALIERARIAAGERVIDVGCGCGATTRAIAEKVGPSGHVLGLDVSAPMLARAKELAPADAPIEFVHADAMVHHFKAVSADLVVSRLGMTYFADPVRAFLNIRTALRSEGRMAFACWRELRENPWFLLPLQAVYEHVPKLPGLPPNAPDQFAFASREWIEYVLGEAGFRRIRLEEFDADLDVSCGRGLVSAVQSALDIGPASRALEGQPAELRNLADLAIRKSLARYAKGQTVMMPVSLWIVTAVDP
jgi:SAM-dependent methyltransferase